MCGRVVASSAREYFGSAFDVTETVGDELQETRPEIAEWRETARDGLAAALAAYTERVDAAARERMSAAS